MIKRSAMAMAEDDYIDMDVSSSFICFTINASSPPQAKEFEFQMSADPRQRDAATSPADELFYMGKLLPLHLPPRLRMVEKLEGSAAEKKVAGPAPAAAAASIPSDVSPPSSCGGSGELSAEDPLASELLEKKPRPKKLRLIKQSSSLCLKLKASRAYLKTLFTRSAALQAEDCANGYMKAAKVNPLATGGEREKLMEEELPHRKSFSGAINWNLTTKSSSSSSSSSSSASSSCSSSLSSSFSSSSSLQLPQQMLKRSSSVNSEMESSILGAIAYCKESQQQLVSGRKSSDDAGLFR